MKLFNQVAVKRPKYSKFDLSHERKLSTNWSKLTPILLQEILPGDKFRVSTEMLIRLAPMKFPVMHRINAYIHYWFVPNRLVWDEWEKFITGGDDGLANPVFPTLDATNLFEEDPNLVKEGSLWDHFGLPLLSTNKNVMVNALPFRALCLIWNEFYRDQNLQDKIACSKTSGVQNSTEDVQIAQMKFRAWEHDYFTSCLPEAQKGGEVLLPFEADVNYRPNSTIIPSAGGAAGLIGATFTGEGNLRVGMTYNENTDLPEGGNLGRIENIENISNGTTTINDLRKAVRLQEWLEKNMRAGSRYAEAIWNFFAIKSSDARLQRPEYLGGGKQPIVISEVLQTYEGTDPLGKMGGHGISVGNKSHFSRTFEEHGIVIGLLSVLPATAYMQGMPKLFDKNDRFDFAFPEFAQLGEQAVLNKEVYFDETDIPNTWNEATFGYIPRYSELKFMNSSVHGQFRTTLANWHMARKFLNRPALNEQFISSADATQDIFNVTDPDEDKLFIQMYHNISAVRALPFFGTPTL